MLLTIGQALDRAMEEEMTVRMHIGGDWITGRVLTCDAQAIAVLETNGDLCVIRKDTIGCVRMPSQAHAEHVSNQPAREAGPGPGVLQSAETVDA